MAEAPPSSERERSPVYSREVSERVLELIAEGKTLRQIRQMEGMPAPSTVNLWVLENRDGFAERYARAQHIRTYGMRDEIVDISDDATLDPNDKRVRIDTRKWLMAKTLPKEFGDRLEAHVDHAVSIKVVRFDELPAPAAKVIEGKVEPDDAD